MSNMDEKLWGTGNPKCYGAQESQIRGSKVEVVSFENISRILKHQISVFVIRRWIGVIFEILQTSVLKRGQARSF